MYAFCYVNSRQSESKMLLTESDVFGILVS